MTYSSATFVELAFALSWQKCLRERAETFRDTHIAHIVPLHLRVWQNFLRPLDITMDPNRLYGPGAQFYLILSQDPDRYQLFDNIYSRVVRPPAKKGAMKFILLLSLSVRCPL